MSAPASWPRADAARMEEAQPALVEAALRGPVVLTRHGRDALVLLPLDALEALLRAARRPVIEG